jgi:hypothetical protein
MIVQLGPLWTNLYLNFYLNIHLVYYSEKTREICLFFNKKVRFLNLLESLLDLNSIKIV